MRDDTDSRLAWTIFEDTGDIEAYLLYHELGVPDGPQREETSHAMQNRRPGDPGTERR